MSKDERLKGTKQGEMLYICERFFLQLPSLKIQYVFGLVITIEKQTSTYQHVRHFPWTNIKSIDFVASF